MLTTTSMPMSGTDAAEMRNMSAAAVPAITWALVFSFATVAVWSLLRAAGVRLSVTLAIADGPPIRTAPLGPRAVSLCEAAMAAAMVAMLFTMR